VQTKVSSNKTAFRHSTRQSLSALHLVDRFRHGLGLNHKVYSGGEGTETSTCVSESVHGVRMTRQRHGALCGVVGRACTNAKNNESSQSEERIGLEMLWGLRAYVNSADPAGQHLLNESVN
jgi:hypothetical protein